MCAVYAFMRRADDISDDEAFSMETRREQMAAWLSSWRSASGSTAEDTKIFLALRDVQQRFGVTDELLDQLVQGTTMDLLPEPPAGVTRIHTHAKSGTRTLEAYQTIYALERYCYLVASVVGLTTIRIFGFQNPQANALAEELGRAFQFTNILRDVKEDADRGRLYLPLDLLEQHNALPDQVLAAAAGAPVSPGLHSALADLAARAERLYASADRLIPLLSPESRPAMRVLSGTYHALLREIQTADYDVFSRRLRVSTPKKLTLLAGGLLAGKLRLGSIT